MTSRDLLAILAILATLVLALTMTTTSWWSAARRTITRQQPRCIRCHTHHLPGHDCDGQPLDKTRETT